PPPSRARDRGAPAPAPPPPHPPPRARPPPRALLAPADGGACRLRALDQVGRAEPPAGEGHVSRLVRVADPEVDRIETEGVGQLVHLGLDGELDLRAAVPAELPSPLLVGVDERGPALNRRRAVNRP